jgi:SAM-dependent methyltransferase
VVESRWERYSYDWVESFHAHYAGLLHEGMTILDVGSGRSPALPPEKRPENCLYVGLDISAEELASAPADAYDQQHILDVRHHSSDLVNSADLAISWQVLEHISPISSAIENVHSYLKPGGFFVSMLSGKNAYFSIMNRLIPEPIGVAMMKHLLRRPPETVFRAYYDSCTYSGLATQFQEWRNVEITPLYRGSNYLSFFRPAQILYLRYEDWLARGCKKDMATHYIVVAQK